MCCSIFCCHRKIGGGFILASRNVLFVAGGAGPPAAASDDDQVWQRMLLMGWTLTFKNDAAVVAGDATGQDCVYVSESCGVANIGAKFLNVTVPVILGDIGTAPAHNLDTGTLAVVLQTVVDLVNTPNPITKFEAGTVAVTPAAQTIGSAVGRNAATSQDWATITLLPLEVVMFGYEKGAVMAAAFVAPERRAAFGIRESAAAATQLANARTWDYLVNLVAWGLRLI